MAHVLGGCVMGEMLHERASKDYQLAAAVREITALKNIINSQQKQLDDEHHVRFPPLSSLPPILHSLDHALLPSSFLLLCQGGIVMQKEIQDREELRESLQDAIASKFTALKAVCPESPGEVFEQQEVGFYPVLLSLLHSKQNRYSRKCAFARHEIGCESSCASYVI